MGTVLDVIIPTWNNPQFFNPCLISIVKTGFLENFGKVIVVNNGSQPISEEFGTAKNFVCVDVGENLGWEGGLKKGLEYSDSEFVCFQNDDTLIPNASYLFYHNLLQPFRMPDVAAVGPVSTVVAGVQSVFHPGTPICPVEVPYLIFFCVAVRRMHYDSVGGLDATLPGGDDLDLSIRFRKDGKKLIVNPKSFLIHHGFKTGERLNGGPDSPGGWNSQEMTDATNKALIQKHGFKMWLGTFTTPVVQSPELSGVFKEDDSEGNVIRGMVNGQKDIVELGCGSRKTVDRAIGVDRVAHGEDIPHLGPEKSVADLTTDVENDDLPFGDESCDVLIGRHILEHCIDTVSVLRRWTRVLRKGGILIIAVPNEHQIRTIPTNPEHVHSFTPESLKTVAEVCGLVQVESRSSGNSISFVSRFEKV